MARIELSETFSVNAPVEVAWRFLLDPHNVVACMPGAELVETVDERTFVGRVKVKVGPIAVAYQGRVQIVEADEAAHSIRTSLEGREGGGGSVRGEMSSRLSAVDGGTEVVVESWAEVTGKVAQFGRGMIQEVSQQLFRQFVNCTKARLESEAAAQPAGAGAPAPAPAGEAPVASAEPVAAPVSGDAAGVPESPPPARPSAATPAAAPPAARPVGAVALTLRALGNMTRRRFQALFSRTRR